MKMGNQLKKLVFFRSDKFSDRLLLSADQFLASLFVGMSALNIKTQRDFCVSELPTPNHRHVFRSIAALAETRQSVTKAAVREVAESLGFGGERILNPNNLDLIDRLPLLVGSGAHVDYFYDKLVMLNNKQRQVSRLWHRLNQYME